MGDTIEIVFEFLRRHHFTKAEEALKSELTARQNVNGLFLPVSDDLERDLTMQPRPYQETAQTLDIAQDSIQQRRLISGVEPTPFLQKDVEEGVSQSFPRRSSSPPEQDLHAEYTSEHVAFTETRNASTGELTIENTETSHEQERRFCPQGSRNVSGSPDQTDLRAAKLSSAQVQEYALVSDSQDMLCESSFPSTAESLNSVSTQSLPEFLKSYSGIDLNEQAAPPASKTMQKEQYAGRHDAQELMPGLHFEGSPIKTVDTLELGKHSSQLEQEEVDISRPQCTSEMGPSSGSQNCNASHELDCTRSKKEDELEKFDKTIIVQAGEVFTKERPQEFGLFLQEPWMKVTTLSFERDNGSSQSVSREADWGKNRFVDSFMCQGSGKDYPLKSPSPVPLADSSLSGDERLVNADESWSKAMEISAVPDLAFERVEDVNETGEGVQGDQGTHEGQLCIESIRNLGAENFPTNGIPDNVVVELPRLPPVKLHSLDKSFENCKEGSCAGNSTRSFESAAFQSIGSTPKGVFGLGALLDLPLGQGPSSSGKHPMARPSVSQGIVEDISEHLSGFATAGDGQSESAKDYPHEFWDSDIYEGDEDPGYHRQPIEDEAWFLAHEIDYPSEDERARKHVQSNRNLLKEFEKFDDNASLVEAESYFSGEEYCRPKQTELQDHCERVQLTYRSKYSRDDENNLIVSCCHEDTDYDGQLMDAEELSIMRSQISLKGIVSQNNELEVHGEDESVSNHSGAHDTCALELDDGCHGSVGSGGICVRSDAFDFGSEVRESLPGASSEGDTGSLSRSELVVHGPTHSIVGNSSSPQEMFCGGFGRHIEEKGAAVRLLDGYNDGGDDDDDDDEDDMILRYYNEAWGHKKRSVQKQVSNKDAIVPKSTKTCINGGNDKVEQDIGSFGLGGFSFPSPSSTGDLAASVAGSGKSPWSTRDSTAQGEETDDYGNGMIRPDDTLAVWKRKSNESSPVISPRNENLFNTALSNPSAFSAHSTEEYVSMETREDVMEGQYIDQLQGTGQADADDEDFANLQEQIRKFGGQDDEYEIFDLRIVHRKNRTGFEEDKDFPVVINSVIAGRYHVTEYLGSAAFSKAIQAHDLYNGMDVCMKVIKNNKDFFDQSLDEIKLLKFINKHDPADKYHILRLYDYFYHREHLFIVCELLRANLYEFHKFNRESGGEVYFTMPRLQSITRQCLEALEFLHGLGLIHCDLKPENILVKSYSRCEIKVIDLGSSCFQTDHLCSYVQSRSYRAPEVILGLPYDEKIDIWSLGCILAELCSGNVLFQNDSIATLLARVAGILGPIDPEMLAQGRDTYKYFTKNHMIYERNQENDQLEYLLPKKTSLSHRLPMGDQGFVEFVGYLLEINPLNRPSATEALNHPWLSYPYEPIIS